MDCLYAWSPLILKEFHNNLHLDISPCFCLSDDLWGQPQMDVVFFAALACRGGEMVCPDPAAPPSRVTWKTPGRRFSCEPVRGHDGSFLSAVCRRDMPLGRADNLFTLEGQRGVFHLIRFLSVLIPSEEGVRLASRLVVALILRRSLCCDAMALKKRDVMSFAGPRRPHAVIFFIDRQSLVNS